MTLAAKKRKGTGANTLRIFEPFLRQKPDLDSTSSASVADESFFAPIRG